MGRNTDGGFFLMTERWSAFVGRRFFLLFALVALFALLLSNCKLQDHAHEPVADIHPSSPLTVLPEGETVEFVAVGDTGSGLSGQKNVAAQMARQYEKSPFGFVLMLGDNIYETGDIQKYAQSRFEKPYAPLLSKNVRFWPVLGNHDTIGGHAKEQIAYFKMPGSYYTFQVDSVQFFALNTNQFNNTQRQWLQSELAKSKTPWKIVYAHHPIYSSGQHGSSKALIRDLKPLLEAYRVPLYLAGHDHEYERFAPKNGVTYIVSGGGGASLRKFNKPVAGSLLRLSVHHFMRIKIKDDTLTFDVLDGTGQQIDTGTIHLNQQKALKPAA